MFTLVPITRATCMPNLELLTFKIETIVKLWDQIILIKIRTYYLTWQKCWVVCHKSGFSYSWLFASQLCWVFYVAALNTKKTDGVKLKQMNSGKKRFSLQKKQESFYFFTLSLNSDRSLPKGEKQKINWVESRKINIGGSRQLCKSIDVFTKRIFIEHWLTARLGTTSFGKIISGMRGKAEGF